jgi:predicted nucleotidyltransferase
MNTLSETQREDIRELLEICRQFGVDGVIIGATAYRLLIEDTQRVTLDIDLAVAIDLDLFGRLEEALLSRGWRHSVHQEPRWTTPRDNRFDLLPAGPALRKEGRLVWPRTGFVMSLAGFEHVFRRAVVQDLGGGLMIKVIPPAVLALLKIVSYLESPELRAKDLDDLKRLLRWYEHDSARIFSETVLQADLPDIEFASAFLLGIDIREICNIAERQLVNGFLERMSKSMNDAPFALSSDSIRFQHQLRAFSKAFPV